jgi:hypothetical protein
MSSNTISVYCISDLHVDYPENVQWVKQVVVPAADETATKENTVLIVAGDVTDRLDLLRTTLSQLKERFGRSVLLLVLLVLVPLLLLLTIPQSFLLQWQP